MDTLAMLGPAALYMISMTLTPGPNNLMLTASGANYGYWRTLPHILGIVAGCFVLFSAIALGLGLLFERFPLFQTLLKIIGSAYLLYLAWKIASAPPPDLRLRGEGRPLTFWQAAAFQWVNPKAWAMALGAVTVYAPDSTFRQILVVAVVFGIVNFPSVWAWVFAGTQLQRLLTNPQRLRLFNWTMAVLLVLSLLPVVLR